MAENGWPVRTYPELNSRVYPDDSYGLRDNEVIRAFRASGQQMWDEDLNNTLTWFRTWVGMSAIYRRIPEWPPWDVRFFQSTIMDQVGGHDDDIELFDKLSGIKSYLSPFTGVSMIVMADRMKVAWMEGVGWKPLFTWSNYRDTIELSIFMSEMRAGAVAATVPVDIEFWLRQDDYGSRVRNWVENPALIIEKNGVPVGTAWVSMYSSGITMTADTQFLPGDRLSIRCPTTYGTGKKAVAVTLIGELA